jgi:hypothetical protein
LNPQSKLAHQAKCKQMLPNLPFNRSARQLGRQAPGALRAPASG